jgi:exodeoxyribonuclease III
MLKNSPNVFRELVDRHDLDVLCLQETKLQDIHLEDPKLNLRETLQVGDDYDDYWSCSTSKKGYSGTAVFVRKRAGSAGKKDQQKIAKQTTLTNFVAKVDKSEVKKPKVDLPIDEELLVPVSVSYGIGKSDHDTEGRTITVDFPRFSLCNVYVPNSGQKLERLPYRTDHWDKDFLAYMQTLSTENDNKPVLWVGDLNVAHTHLEVWNDGAKHLAKQAGVTAEERASFQSQLDSGYVDAFRRLHPTAAGHYSYWSTRAGNRPVNKGLRLDYFICHPDFFKADGPVVVRDCYMDFDQVGSDHCPVILELAMQ